MDLANQRTVLTERGKSARGAVGPLFGVVRSWGAPGWMSYPVFEVSSRDPIVFSAAALVAVQIVSLAALVSSWPTALAP